MDEQFTPIPKADTLVLPLSNAAARDSANDNLNNDHGINTVAIPHTLHHHQDGSSHSHTHGAIAPEIATSARGLWAVKWAFMGLMLTAIVQAIVFLLSDSVALLADLIHNLADASTAVAQTI